MRWFTHVALLVAMAVLPACNNGSGDNGGGVVPLSGLKILAKGGTGTDGQGGTGGYVDVWSRSGLRVLQSGTVNNTFSIPDVSPDLGANPLTIAADVTLSPSGFATYTGLHVLAGVTLTITPDTDGTPIDPSYYYDTATLTFASGVQIDGTVKMGPRVAYIPPSKPDGILMGAAITEDDTASLILSAENLVITSGGRIDLTGNVDSDDKTGGTGGNLTVTIAGTLINKGAIDASGGGGWTGGNGGNVSLTSSENGLYNSGSITTSGGSEETSFYGGFAGNIAMSSSGSYGLYNSGPLTAIGGSGTGFGRDGGDITLIDNSSPNGAVLSSGILNASGGDATEGGQGGLAGQFNLNSAYGPVRVTGALYARGGNSIVPEGGLGKPSTAGAAQILSRSSLGGSGGNVWMGSAVLRKTGLSASLLVTLSEINGECVVGADIDVSGGNSDVDGGQAGGVDIGSGSGGAEIMYLVGYSLIDISGGDGADGGDAGSDTISLSNDSVIIAGPGKVLLAVGEGASGKGIFNEVPLVARGGKGTAGNGGDGGSVDLEDAANGPVDSSGPIDVSGGEGTLDGGYGGYIGMFGLNVTSSAALNANGGNGGTVPGSDGGEGGYVEIGSLLPPSTLDPMPTVDGGDGTTPGADGGVMIDGFIIS
jgi:hypothetical protein